MSSPTSFSSSPPLPKPPPPPLMSPTRKYKKIGRRKKYKVTNFREHCRFSFFFFLVFSLFELSGNGEYFVHFFTSSLAIDDSLPDCLCVSNLVCLSPLVTFMMFISFQFLYVLFIHTLQRIKMYCAGSILIIIRRRSMSTLFYFLFFTWLLFYQGLYYKSSCQHSELPLWESHNIHSYKGKKQIFCANLLFCLYSSSKFGRKCFTRNNMSFMFQILLLSGDVEKNPGPENWYSLKHPNMCGFFRAAVYFIFQGQKLLPVDKKELELCIDINQGFLDMQNLFVNHFDILQLNLKNLKKNISRFHDLNKQWARNNNEAKEEYYDSFSPQKWVKLTKTEQNNHTLFCKECQKTYCHITAKFPSKANLYEDARKENPILLAKSLKKQVKKEKNTLKIATNKVCQEMNSGFISTYGVSFEESFMSLNKVEKQTRESRRQLKKKHYKEAVTTINEDGGTTVVDRLYGSGSSLRKWDRERKKSTLRLSLRQKSGLQLKN